MKVSLAEFHFYFFKSSMTCVKKRPIKVFSCFISCHWSCRIKGMALCDGKRRHYRIRYYRIPANPIFSGLKE